MKALHSLNCKKSNFKKFGTHTIPQITHISEKLWKNERAVLKN